ncbi:MAG TPA: helix-turn-helix transcriptional regulator [Gemmatimonadaceae bacterium]|nr:helix-turn-helix transcriptional regulator [Gemmatimonadaceae bacterium]
MAAARITFTHHELRAVERTLARLTAWADTPDAWATDACFAIRDLLEGDHSVFSEQVPGAMRYLTPDAPPEARASLERLVPRMTGERPAEQPIARLLMLERAGAFDAWTSASLDVLLDGQFTRGPFYQELVLPSGMREVVGLTTRAPGRVSRISVGYRGARRRSGEHAMALLRLMRPAFEAGAGIAERQRTIHRALVDSVEVAGDGFWLLTAGGRELHRNAALDRVLSHDPDRAAIMAAARRLAPVIGSLHAGTSHPRRGSAVDGPPLTSTLSTRRGVYTLRAGAVPPGLGLPADATLVLVRPPATVLGVEELHERFGLSRREAEVAILLAGRRTTTEIARQLGISPHTVRRHVERVLAALNVRSRTDVAAALGA